MEHGRERTEFGGARRAENGVNMFYEPAETMGGHFANILDLHAFYWAIALVDAWGI